MKNFLYKYFFFINQSFTKAKKTISFDNGFSDDDGSVADQNDIAKILKDTEDMDGDLFKNLNKNNTSNSSLAKTMPAMTRNKSKLNFLFYIFYLIEEN